MITTRKETVEKDVLDIVVCNKCRTPLSKSDIEYGNYLRVDNTWGYSSHIFGDGMNMKFELCESCTKWLVQQFSIPPDLEDAW